MTEIFKNLSEVFSPKLFVINVQGIRKKCTLFKPVIFVENLLIQIRIKNFMSS